MLADCCGPLLSGDAVAQSAEQLMRSRYTAFVLKDSDYLLASWHSTTRPAELDLSGDTTQWTGLQVITTTRGGAGETAGTVEFIADYRQGGQAGRLHEVSRFRREAGRWVYVDGDIQAPGAQRKVARNTPCPCGSGKKYKRCCGT